MLFKAGENVVPSCTLSFNPVHRRRKALPRARPAARQKKSKACDNGSSLPISWVSPLLVLLYCCTGVVRYPRRRRLLLDRSVLRQRDHTSTPLRTARSHAPDDSVESTKETPLRKVRQRRRRQPWWRRDRTPPAQILIVFGTPEKTKGSHESWRGGERAWKHSRHHVQGYRTTLLRSSTRSAGFTIHTRKPRPLVVSSVYASTAASLCV